VRPQQLSRQVIDLLNIQRAAAVRTPRSLSTAQAAVVA
jgi:hypothetical protein